MATLISVLAVRALSDNKKYDDAQKEEYYAIAMDEINNHSVKDGIWAKAYARTDGDDTKAKALYIKLRVKDLLSSQ